MKNFSFLLLLLSLLIFTESLRAQSLGGHPFGINWKTVSNNYVRVIYPEGQKEKAERVANIIEVMAEEHSATIGEKVKRYDLVLQTNQVISNGYVGLAPLRSEFFLTPFQNNLFLGSSDWLDLLAIHEYRHVQQFTNARHGVTKWLYFLQGEAGWAFGLGLSVPDWFYEGDAVLAETDLTFAGRGRTPAFFSMQRALLLNDRNYSYTKARNGSLKDMVPNHYRLGYVMVKYGREKFRNDLWADVLKEGGSYRRGVYPFSNSLKKHTELTTSEMYDAAYSELKEKWEQELSSLKLTHSKTVLAAPKKTVTNYRYPNFLSDGSLLYYKSSFKKIPALYHFKEGKETKLTELGRSPEPFLSVSNGKVAWTESKTNARRLNKNFTVIKSYDLANKSKSTLTKKGKWFSPQFSHSGEKIIVLEADEFLKYNLVVLDAESGEEINRIPNPNNNFISYPQWTLDDKGIVYVEKREHQLALRLYRFSDTTTISLSPWSSHTIGNFDLSRDKVYFNAAYSGIDNIYSAPLDGSKEITQITSVKVGAYMPTIPPDESKLVASELSDMGLALTEIELSEGLNDSVKPDEPIHMERYYKSLNQSEPLLLSVRNKTLQESDYRGPFRGTKLHSWSLSGIQANDILDNFSARTNFLYDQSAKTIDLGANVSYAGFYPVLSATYNSDSDVIDFDENGDGEEREITLREQQLRFSASVPLLWFNGTFLTRVNLTPNLAIHKVTNNEDFEALETDATSGAMNLSFSHLKRTARQNVGPRLGFAAVSNYAHILDNSNSWQSVSLLALYGPGLWANHQIKFTGAYRKQENELNPFLTTSIGEARGYNGILAREMFLLTANYHMPLIYPDIGIKGIVYLLRCRANFFFDHLSVRQDNDIFEMEQQSVGVELFFDFKFLNVLPLSLGVRASFQTDNFGDPQFDFVL